MYVGSIDNWGGLVHKYVYWSTHYCCHRRSKSGVSTLKGFLSLPWSRRGWLCLKWCNLICCRIDLSQRHVWAANGGMYKLRYVPVFRSPQRLCSNRKYFIFIIPTKTRWTPCATYQFTTTYAAICSVDIYFYYLQNLQNVKYTIVDIWVKLKDSLVIGFIFTAW